ncbi:unnamed protein product, partial [Phaeothamnion confervicola]
MDSVGTGNAAAEVAAGADGNAAGGRRDSSAPLDAHVVSVVSHWKRLLTEERQQHRSTMKSLKSLQGIVPNLQRSMTLTRKLLQDSMRDGDSDGEESGSDDDGGGGGDDYDDGGGGGSSHGGGSNIDGGGGGSGGGGGERVSVAAARG